MMKEHFTMYSIVVIVSGKCVHVDGLIKLYAVTT